MFARGNVTRAARRMCTLAALLAPAACSAGAIGTRADSASAVPLAAPRRSIQTYNGNPLPPPRNAMFLGAWANPTGSPPGWSSSQKIALLEKLIGRTFAISLHYDRFADPFPSSDEAADLTNHRIPLISLNCDDTDYNIAHGSQDAVLNAKADAIKAFGEPVLIRYKWEFNLAATVNGRQVCVDSQRDKGGYFSPMEYIAAFKHIHDLMLGRGAKNISWMWNPSYGGTSGIPYWPGDWYVDWVGIDVYNFSSSGPGVLQAPYAMYVSIGDGTHPIFIGETGAPAADQASYLNAGTPAIFKAQFPQLRALDYFDGSGRVGDFSFSAPGLTTFTRFAADPYLGGTAP